MNKYVFKRAIGFYVDAFFIAIFTMIILLVLDELFVLQNTNKFIVYFFTWIIYYLTQEIFFRQTLGKMLTGMEIIFLNNKKFKAALIRTVVRLIPLEPLSIFFRNDSIMWHDQLSGTKVIDRRSKIS